MPRPEKGESEQDYVSRFMASEEARKDLPDEKQRAAVAYSMYRERNNTMAELCPECGAATERRNGALAPEVACTNCSYVQRFAPEAAKVELANTCPHCTHDLKNSHDDIGCTAKDCSCSEARNAVAEKKNSGPNPHHFRNPTPERLERARGVGLEDFEDEDLTTEGLHAKLAALEEGHGDTGTIRGLRKKLGMENASEHELAAAWERFGDDMVDELGLSDKATVSVPSGKLHPYGMQPAEVRRRFKESYEDAHENRNNQRAASEVWGRSERHQRAAWLDLIGTLPEALADTDWSAMPENARVILTRAMGFQNNSDACACGHAQSDHNVQTTDKGHVACSKCECRAFEKANAFDQMTKSQVHNENAREAPEGFRIATTYAREDQAKEHAKLCPGAKVDCVGQSYRVLVPFQDYMPPSSEERMTIGAAVYGGPSKEVAAIP